MTMDNYTIKSLKSFVVLIRTF